MKLTTTQFASRCQPPVKAGTVRQWIKRGIVPAMKVGRDSLIDSRHLMNGERKSGRPRR